MSVITAQRLDAIRELNDTARQTFTGCAVCLTSSVAAIDPDIRKVLLDKVRRFDEFDPGNDPHGEHDMGFIELYGERFMWKFDYYDRAVENASPDPSDPTKTTRLLHVLYAHEY